MPGSNRSRYPRSYGASRRRSVGWEDGPFTTPIAASAATSVLWSTGQGTGADDNQTLVRVRGEFSAFLSLATAALDGFIRCAVGIGIVTAPAFAVGVTACPTPLTEIEWDGWLYHRQFSLIAAEATEAFGNAGSASIRVEIDSKAMRKISSDMVIFGCFEFGTPVGTTTVNAYANTRMLIKHPA